MTRLGGKPFRVSRLAVLLLFGGLLNLAIHTSVSGKEGEAEKVLSLTTGEVQRLRERAEEAKDLAEETKAKILETYDKALARLEASVDWSNKAADFDRVREEAPEAAEAIEKELKADVPELWPELPEDASLDQLEQALTEVKLDLEAVNEQLSKLESEVTRRRERRKKVPELLAAARQRLLEAREQGPEEGAGPPELFEAQRTLREAKILAVEAEISALRREVPSYDARTKLLNLRLDQALRIQAAKEKEAEFLKEKVTQRRREEAERDAREAREALIEVTDASPEIRQFAEELASETAELAEKRTGPEGILEKIEAISTRTGETNELLKKVRADFASVEKRVEAAGRLSAPIGALLRQRRADLPNVQDRKGDIRARRDEIEKAQIKIIEVREERQEVSDVQSVASKKMSGVDPSLPEYQRRRMERLLRELLWKKRSSLQSLLNDYTTYFEKLMELDARDRELVDAVQEFDSFIDERILWVRSVEPFKLETGVGVWSSLKWIVRPDNWKQVVMALWGDVSKNLGAYILAALLLVGVLAGSRRMAVRLRAVHEEAGKPWCTDFGPTVEALLLTLLLSALLPAFIWMLGWRLRASGGAADFLNAIGSALQFTAVMYLTLEIPRQVFKPDGLGRIHFGWPGDRLDDMYRILGRAFVIVLPAVFVIAAAEGQPDEALKVHLVRVAFVLLMLAVSALLFIMLRPRLSAKGGEASVQGGRPIGAGRFGYAAIVAVPLAIGVVEYLGYYYAALELGLRLLATACLVIAVLILQGLIMRWLLLAHRRLAIAENEKHVEVFAAEDPGEGEARAQEPEEQLDLAKVQVQANRLLRGIIAFVLLIGIWLIWVEVVRAFGILREVELWHTTREVSQIVTDAEGKTIVQTLEQLRAFTLADLLLAIVVLVMTLLATKNLPGILQVVLLQRFGLGAGERAAISTIVQYTILVIGGTFIFKIIGVGWGNIQWLVAALGVGIGFGLQEIVANFISGLIILFERPIRVGDAVTVGDISGIVSKIRIRATSITSWDRKELIVPNKEFVTGRLVNWTFSDPILRVEIPVGIAYGSDTEMAKERMRKVAEANEKVLRDPPPSVLFMGFGESSLDFELRAHTKFDTMLSVRDELNMAIDKAFREAGIEIAFPQRDIHIRSVKDTVPSGTKKPDEKAEQED
jgi:potassium efflux system protein